MKNYFLLFAFLMLSLTVKAINYDDAREYAWQLTDKMAYELDLTDEQYDRAYEINLNYLMSVGSSRDVYGTYWSYRQSDLRYILVDWQFDRFLTTSYFIRPLSWYNRRWCYPLYNYYRRDLCYFGRRDIITYYRGGRYYPGRRYSPYRDLRVNHNGGMRHYYDRDHNRPRNVGRPTNNRPSNVGQYNRPERNQSENDRYNRPTYNRKPNNEGEHNRPTYNRRPNKEGEYNRPTNRRPTDRTQRPSKGHERPTR
ncbi:MAG: hypothetical protein RR386_01825 [Bacteroidaceae bacterium]